MTNPAWGCAPAGRSVAERIEWGVVVLDKPSGPTSRRAAESVRRLLGASKAGHGGTLDPKVTGVLPVLLGRATRAAAVLIGCDKAYEGLMVLHADVSDEDLGRGMRAFVGIVQQLPPRRSRVKRAARDRAVYEFQATGRQGREVRFSVRCQGGTYVRKLVHDLGAELECGAHMQALRRTSAGPFALAEAVTLDDLRAAASALGEGDGRPVTAAVLQVEDVLARVLPTVTADDGAVFPVCCGVPLAVPGICSLDDFERGDTVVVLTLKGELIGFGEALMGTTEILGSQHGRAVAVHQVLIARDTYPRGPQRAV